MNEKFKELLESLPKIAEAVNSFSSEELQIEAFHTLMDLSGNSFDEETRKSVRPKDNIKPESKEGITSKKKFLKEKDSPTLIKDLDLNPKDKKSFQDFIAEKNPSSNEDKYPVIVYYLESILELHPITINHIFSVFRFYKAWKEPINLKGGLKTASSRKGTIDTTDMYDIKMTPTGRNFVEHDLPRKIK